MQNELSAKQIRELPRGHRNWVAPLLYINTLDPPGRWLLLYRSPLLNKTVEMGLGPARDVSLAQAKTEALRYRLMIREGRCPMSERRAAQDARRQGLAEVARQAGRTFRIAAEAYIAAHEPSWRSRTHAEQWRATLATYTYPNLGALPVARITAHEVAATLQPIWHTKPETAARLRGRIESVLDYARARKWCSGENAARWRGGLDALLPARDKRAAVKHHPSLDWRAAPQVYQALARQDRVPALVARYLMLTALRFGEAVGTLPGEIDIAAKLQVIPPERQKSGREFRCALSDEALAVIAAAEECRSGRHLFSGARAGRPASRAAVADCFQALAPDTVLHGLRATFRSWCADQGVARELAEACLAHVVESRTERAYLRSDTLALRQAVMTKWAEFLAAPAAENTPEAKKVAPSREELVGAG
jgi:integrase